MILNIKGVTIIKGVTFMNLNIKRVTIERAHRTGKISSKNPRTIVMNLLNYKDKIKILKSNGMYSIVIYDKLIVKEFRKNQNAKI